MGKIPSDRPAGAARYNPMARPETARPASPTAPAAPRAGSRPGSPASEGGSPESPMSPGTFALMDRFFGGITTTPPGSPSGHPPGPGAAPERSAASSGESPRPVSPHPESSAGSTPGSSSPPGSPLSPGTRAFLDEVLPWNATPPDSPKTQGMKALLDRENRTHEGQSRWNGYKLMSPDVQEAIRHADRNFPSNIDGIVGPNPQEHAQVFHASGAGGLVPGELVIGTDNKVALPGDIRLPTARVTAHQHPYTGLHVSDTVSMGDQLLARGQPAAEHIVQIPAPGPGQANPYLIFSGAYPPRHYTLVSNPRNLPVPPHSPDGEQVPPFRPPPGSP